MKQLLEHVDLISRCRKRGEAEAALVNAVQRCLGAKCTELHKIFMPSGDVLVGLSLEVDAGSELVMHDDGFSWPEQTRPIDSTPHLQACFGNDLPLFDIAPDASSRMCLMLRNVQHEPYGFLVILRDAPIEPAEIDLVRGLCALLKNTLALLDYGETDTLTRLLNRKTFDEYLMSILATLPAPDDASDKRQKFARRGLASLPTRDHWLGVMDIDKFKSINDRFGHLIGDEVLILMADLMRNNFRVQDRLFRFGGEEFVALLRPAELVHAKQAFERFRTRVENFAFPQVGRVTISIGFACIKLGDTPSRILDNADEALYWAKEHGRNQCHAYEALVESGQLQRQVVQEPEIEFF